MSSFFISLYQLWQEAPEDYYKSNVKEISMEKIVVQGGDNRLVGSVTIEGAKNAVLPLLAATILASEGKTVLQNVPILSDVFTMNQVVRGLNAKVDFDEEAHLVEVDATGDRGSPYKYVSKMRASIVVLGPPCPCRSCQGIHARWLYDW